MGPTSPVLHDRRTVSIPSAARTRAQAAADQASAKLRDELIASHMPMAARIARTFSGRGADLDDLTQVAMLALVKASSRFDPGRGVTFAQYVYPCIVGDLKKHFRDTGWSLHITRRMQELHLETSQAIPALTQTLGRIPTVSDLAGYLHLSEKDIRDGLNGRLAYKTWSLNMPLIDGQDNELGALLGGLDEHLESVADRHTLAQHVATLPGREQRILKLRFEAQLSQREIAERLGISQMHVSRMLTRSMELLRARITDQD